MDIHKISSSIYNTDTLKGLKLAVLSDLLFTRSRLLNFAFCRANPDLVDLYRRVMIERNKLLGEWRIEEMPIPGGFAQSSPEGEPK